MPNPYYQMSSEVRYAQWFQAGCCQLGKMNLDLAGAIQCLKQAMAIKPDAAEVWYQLGAAHAHQKWADYNQARYFLSKAVELDPTFSDAWYELAKLHMAPELRSYDRALRALYQTILHQPRHKKAYERLRTHVLFAPAAMLDEAIDIVKLCAENQPNNAEWFFRHAAMLKRITSPEMPYAEKEKIQIDALRSIDKALELEPESEQFTNLRVQLLELLAKTQSHLSDPIPYLEK